MCIPYLDALLVELSDMSGNDIWVNVTLRQLAPYDNWLRAERTFPNLARAKSIAWKMAGGLLS